MDISLEWNSEFLPAVLGIAVALLGFIFYWFMAHSQWLKTYLEKRDPENGKTILLPLVQKYLGVFWMGIVPAIILLVALPYTLADYYLTVGDIGYSVKWTLGLGGVLVLVNWFAARRPETLAYYPQVRAKEWTPKLVFHNTLAWVLYLFAYEFLFRGLLLFSCLAVLDPWVAISINIALYSATHIPKGFTESMVTIPFGIGVCILTMGSGAIWIAWLAHVAVALSNDYVALKFNPEMKIVKPVRK